MTKDRLLELRTNQVEIRGDLGNGIPSLSSSGSASTQEDRSTKKKSSKKNKKSQKTIDDAFKETQQMRAWLEAIEEETKLVKRLHTVILNSTRAESETRDKLLNAMIKIKTLSLRVRASLKSLERNQEEMLSPVERRMVSVQHSTLSKRFQTAMADYQGALAHHRDQTEAHIKTQLRIANFLSLVQLIAFYLGLTIGSCWERNSNSEAEVQVIQTVTRRPAVLAGSRLDNPEELEALLDRETTQVFVDNYVHETQVMKLALQDARIRHQEMLDLEKSIKELHELFTDVSAMVHTQGEMINVIEYNVEQGTGQVTQGNQEMSQAYTKKKSARRKKMWCFFIIACIFGVILVLAALHSLITSIFTF